MLVSTTSFIWNASSGSFCMTLPNSSYVTDNSLLLIMSSDYKTCHFCDVPRHNAALIYLTHLSFVPAGALCAVSPTRVLWAVHWPPSSTHRCAGDTSPPPDNIAPWESPENTNVSYFPCLWAEDFHPEFSSANHFFLFGRSTCRILVEGVSF